MFLGIPHAERFLGLHHQADGSDVTGGALEVLLQFLGLHGAKLARLDQREQLGFVHRLVAAQESYDRLFLSLGAVFAGFLRHVGHRFDVLLGGNVQELRHIGDGSLAGRVDEQRLAVAFRLEVFDWGQLRGGLLHIRGVVALLAADDLILARRGAHHELLRLRSAHRAGVRVDHHVLQPAAVEDAAVGVVVLEIRDVEPGGVHVERVRVLHDELAHAQQARLGTGLVAELGLNLIPDLGKLLVAAQFLAGDRGHDLFMGHAQAKFGALAVFQAKHVVAHHRPAPALLPKFARVERWEEELLADLVHFLADDPHDFLGRAIAEEQERVNARAQLSDVSRADEELVTGDLGISRGLAKSRNKEFRPAVHGFIKSRVASSESRATGRRSFRKGIRYCK